MAEHTGRDVQSPQAVALWCLSAVSSSVSCRQGPPVAAIEGGGSGGSQVGVGHRAVDKGDREGRSMLYRCCCTLAVASRRCLIMSLHRTVVGGGHGWLQSAEEATVTSPAEDRLTGWQKAAVAALPQDRRCSSFDGSCGMTVTIEAAIFTAVRERGWRFCGGDQRPWGGLQRQQWLRRLLLMLFSFFVLFSTVGRLSSCHRQWRSCQGR